MSESFATALSKTAEIHGWMTDDQARLLWDSARSIPSSDPRILEIGSHHGRSTIVLAASRDDATVVAIDPFVDGVLFGGAGSQQVFEGNVERAGVSDRIDLRVAKAEDLLPTWNGEIDLLYVDGKHDALSCTRDLRWRRFLPEGGTMLVHDSFSSIGVTLAVLWATLTANDLVYLDRAQSMARFVRRRPSLADRLRPARELPWWIRNVVIKVLRRLRLHPLTRLLGHHQDADPF